MSQREGIIGNLVNGWSDEEVRMPSIFTTAFFKVSDLSDPSSIRYRIKEHRPARRAGLPRRLNGGKAPWVRHTSVNCETLIALLDSQTL